LQGAGGQPRRGQVRAKGISRRNVSHGGLVTGVRASGSKTREGGRAGRFVLGRRGSKWDDAKVARPVRRVGVWR